jgi:hypothetical protein
LTLPPRESELITITEPEFKIKAVELTDIFNYTYTGYCVMMQFEIIHTDARIYRYIDMSKFNTTSLNPSDGFRLTTVHSVGYTNSNKITSDIITSNKSELYWQYSNIKNIINSINDALIKYNKEVYPRFDDLYTKLNSLLVD